MGFTKIKVFAILTSVLMTFSAQAQHTFSVEKVWETASLNNPESVVFDKKQKALYISNVNGAPGDKDGNGYIAKVRLDGNMITQQWVTGLNAPKGMRIYKGKIYVADIDEIVEIDISSAKILNKYKAEGATFLNDVAVDINGDVYVTNTFGFSGIYRLKNGKVELWAKGDHLNMPNGILVDSKQIITAGWGEKFDPKTFATEIPGKLIAISKKDKSVLTSSQPIGNLDGLEKYHDGYLVTDWYAGKLFFVNDKQIDQLLALPKGSADIELNGDMVYIPLMNDNKLEAYKLKVQKPARVTSVIQLNARPGNVTVSAKGDVFSTIHPLDNPDFQLIKVKSNKKYELFPSASWQRKASETAGQAQFDTPIGIVSDKDNNLWVIDMGLNIGKTRLFSFNSETGNKTFELSFPETVAPKGSFIQDLAVDTKNRFVYLADIANPGILVVNLNDNSVRRLKQHASFLSENIDMVINKKLINFKGKPARIAIDPITLSADGDTIFYGAMNGQKWYSISAKAIRENKNDDDIFATIKIAGEKPISDGAYTDEGGNHYFTNLTSKGIDKWDAKTGALRAIVRSEKLDWADNVVLGQDGYFYLSVNQLYKTSAFTGNKDQGKPPYYIYKIKNPCS